MRATFALCLSDVPMPRWKKRTIIAGTLLAAFVILSGIFATEGAMRLPRRSIDPSAAATAHALAGEDVEVLAPDGVRLRAWFFRSPKGASKAVIVLHGHGDNRVGAFGFAPLLLKHGYDVLTPDSRAHGESEGVATYGVLEADDVNLWARWLATERTDPCVCGLGESMGAAILLQALARETPIRAVVAESPFSSFREAAYDRIGEKFGVGHWLPRTLLRPTIETAFLYSRLRYGIDMASASPEAAVAHTPIPILLIHGAEDINLPPVHSRRILAHAAGRIEYWEPSQTWHTGASTRWPLEFGRRVTAWFARACP